MAQMLPLSRGEASRQARRQQLTALVIATLPLLVCAVAWLVTAVFLWNPATTFPRAPSQVVDENRWALLIGGTGITGLIVLPVVTWAGLSTLRAWDSRDSPVLRRRATTAAWLTSARGTVTLSVALILVFKAGGFPAAAAVGPREAWWLLPLGLEVVVSTGTAVLLARWHTREARYNFPGQTRPLR